MQNKFYEVVIIGAGASGLFAAQLLGGFGKSVLLIDHANKVGKKILMSGGGRCNFTNNEVDYTHFVGSNPHFVRSALSKFRPEDFLTYIYRYNIDFFEKTYGDKRFGELFCRGSAKNIVDMLLDLCQQNGVIISTHTTATAIKACTNSPVNFMISCIQNGKNLPKKSFEIQASRLIIATGGLSVPTMGASGFGYEVAHQFGHSIVPTTPSLVPFTFSDAIKDLANELVGVSHEVVAFNERKSFERPMLFTHRGLSGPAMLQLSNYWQSGETIFVNLLPMLRADDFLLHAKKTSPKERIRTVLEGYFSKNLLLGLERKLWFDVQDKPLIDIKDKVLITLGNTLNAWQLKPSGTEGYRVAEVTCGGVNTDEVSSKSFESKLQPNLYFIGEVLDVAGHLGGFNFQWAWASAAACASYIADG